MIRTPVAGGMTRVAAIKSLTANAMMYRFVVVRSCFFCKLTNKLECCPKATQYLMKSLLQLLQLLRLYCAIRECPPLLNLVFVNVLNDHSLNCYRKRWWQNDLLVSPMQMVKSFQCHSYRWFPKGRLISRCVPIGVTTGVTTFINKINIERIIYFFTMTFVNTAASSYHVLAKFILLSALSLQFVPGFFSFLFFIFCLFLK